MKKVLLLLFITFLSILTQEIVPLDNIDDVILDTEIVPRENITRKAFES